METPCVLLPELPQPPGKDMPPCPTAWSNWVIPGYVLAGAYPASLDDEDTAQLLTLLLELGVNTFVCLQAEVNIHLPEHSWRAGLGLRPYIRDAQRLLSKAQASGSSRIRQRKVDFLHLPIIDGSVTTDAALSRLADDCCERVLRGEVLYIHCWGGHGRTGTLVAVMLGRLYNLPSSAALRCTQAYHDLRAYPQGVRSPQTPVQRAQVKRLLLQPNPFAAIAAKQQAARAAGATGGPLHMQQQQQAGATSIKAAAAACPGSPVTPVKHAALPASLARANVRSPLTPPAAAAAAGGGSSSSRQPLAFTTGLQQAPAHSSSLRGGASGSSRAASAAANLSFAQRMQQLAVSSGTSSNSLATMLQHQPAHAPVAGSSSTAAVGRLVYASSSSSSSSIRAPASSPAAAGALLGSPISISSLRAPNRAVRGYADGLVTPVAVAAPPMRHARAMDS